MPLTYIRGACGLMPYGKRPLRRRLVSRVETSPRWNGSCGSLRLRHVGKTTFDYEKAPERCTSRGSKCDGARRGLADLANETPHLGAEFQQKIDRLGAATAPRFRCGVPSVASIVGSLLVSTFLVLFVASTAVVGSILVLALSDLVISRKRLSDVTT